MLTHPCPRTIDEPIRVLGLDGEDWLASASLGVAVYLLLSALPGLVAGLVTGVLLRVAKRGQPPGALQHGLWWLGVPLPGWPPAPPTRGERYSPWR